MSVFLTMGVKMGNKRVSFLFENTFHILLFIAVFQSIIFDSRELCFWYLVIVTVIELLFSVFIILKSNITTHLLKAYKAKMQLQKNIGVLSALRQMVV